MNNSNEYTLSERDDHFASSIVDFCSATVFDYRDDAKIEEKARALNKNKFILSGKKWQRFVKETGEI